MIIKSLSEERWSVQRAYLIFYFQGNGETVLNQTTLGTTSRALLKRLLRDQVGPVWIFPGTELSSRDEIKLKLNCETRKIVPNVLPEKQLSHSENALAR